ncbi:hypothetical protein MHY_10730 [Megamonas hypermegale ART12/1]|nr:hypothetical protein MHY_10730 [Megamonas hypermegale ART12/1]
MAEEKVKFFQEMQASYEGFGKAVKRVLKADKSWQKWYLWCCSRIDKGRRSFYYSY